MTLLSSTSMDGRSRKTLAVSPVADLERVFDDLVTHQLIVTSVDAWPEIGRRGKVQCEVLRKSRDKLICSFQDA